MTTLLPGKRSELAMRYTILVMLAPFIFTIPFIKSFGRDLGLPEKHIETDIGIALLGFLLGPVLFLGIGLL
ncbi:MAG: hypothetical protein GXO26_07875, partial [Crenarchaeota archaeon]|nr:hypothetical protein [Thermoproteota archaeon]